MGISMHSLIESSNQIKSNQIIVVRMALGAQNVMLGTFLELGGSKNHYVFS
jgi:hypothetical protein